MKRLELPEAFRERIQGFHLDSPESFLLSLDQQPPVSVRVNPRKRIEAFDHCMRVTWATDAFYLPERISFTLDPLFHAGCYYVQEASSMYLEAAFKSVADLNRPLKVLDLCAAPGGKSTHLLSFLPDGSFLVSNEIIPARNKILRQNMVKWGAANVVVTQNEPVDFGKLAQFFDVIVIDAPCSGEGLFRKDPAAVNEWSPAAVDICAARQKDILEQAIAALRPDGILIYSTCTYEEAENDRQMDRLVSSGGFEKLELPLFYGIQRTGYGVQFYPHLVMGEGFYLAALKKSDGQEQNFRREKFSYHQKYRKHLQDFLDSDKSFEPYLNVDLLYAIPECLADAFPLLMKNLYIKQAGIHLGKVIRDELVPSHDLALSCDKSGSLSKIEVDYDTAISFLRCETIKTGDASPGWYLVAYRGHVLGWVKVMKGRNNNYFPSNQRILMDISKQNIEQ